MSGDPTGALLRIAIRHRTGSRFQFQATHIQAQAPSEETRWECETMSYRMNFVHVETISMQLLATTMMNLDLDAG